MTSTELIDMSTHGVIVDRPKSKVECKYCNKIISNGFYRLKYHLGGVKGDVTACLEVPEEVKEVFRTELAGKEKKLPEKQIVKTEQPPFQLKRKLDTHLDIANGKSAGAQIDIDKLYKRIKIVDQIPSCEELKQWISNDKLIKMQNDVQEIQISWERTGCTVFLDTWTNLQRQKFINIFVICPKGAIYLKSSNISTLMKNVNDMQLFIEGVIQEVGIQNVVQVITNSSSVFMEVVGKQIVAKYRHVFWTICVSTCIELMLDRFKAVHHTKEVLEKAGYIAKYIHTHAGTLKDLGVSDFIYNPINPSKIRSIAPYLALDKVLRNEDILVKLFASADWEASNLSSSPEGKRVAKLVKSFSFWNEAEVIMTASTPLLHELNWINGNQAQTGYVYRKIDQLKKTIRVNLGKKEYHTEYVPFWEAIDEIWNNYFHTPLHSAAYYLNPSLFYSERFCPDQEVVVDLNTCIVRMVGEDYYIRRLIRSQAVKYLDAKHNRSTCVTKPPPNSSPVIWWSNYEREFPELSRIAIRILSQACDGASMRNLNRNLAERLLNETRPAEQQLLANYAFLHYNMQLQNFDSRNKV